MSEFKAEISYIGSVVIKTKKPWALNTYQRDSTSSQWYRVTWYSDVFRYRWVARIAAHLGLYELRSRAVKENKHKKETIK